MNLQNSSSDLALQRLARICSARFIEEICEVCERPDQLKRWFTIDAVPKNSAPAAAIPRDRHRKTKCPEH
jgi:hypothetical protein